MAQKKKRPGAKKKKAGKNPEPPGRPLLRGLLTLLILGCLVALLVFLADRHLIEEEPGTASAPKAPVAKKAEPPRTVPAPPKKPAQKQAARPPVYEVFPAPEKPPSPKKPAPPDGLPPKAPRIAIIIDDLGYDEDMAGLFCSLDYPVTISILPDSPHAKSVAALARSKGKQVLLHLPMEPLEYPAVDPGPGALLSGMETDEMLAVLESDLASVPYAQGVNNHMGSRLSREETVLNPLFTALKARGLFFVDSVTAPGPQARAAARMLRLPFAQRDVFLDHEQTREFVEKQMDRLVALAQKNGHAIGIGHPHEVTYEVLRERLPELADTAVISPVSELTEIVD